MTHTPTPWQLNRDVESESDLPLYAIWTDHEGGSQAELAGRIGEEANAHLFFAAPDLLAAAKRAKTVLEGMAQIRHPGDTIDELTAAIEKAESQTSLVT